ncbi:hypothetical protein [Kitasatospora sp. NPDC088779]|uniref:hypothetical protein n=1 Tax=Kitasatospora sp. NPDC088779 TaxID=3154964 RepID=UPI00341FED22
MGKAARLRRERAEGLRRGRPVHVVFTDVDYERGSRAHGKGVAPVGPEGWVIGRAGLVHAEWDGEQLNFTGDELIEGTRPASAWIEAVRPARLVVGHGILTSDLRSAVMVTDVPDRLLARTVDTLALAHRLRGKQYPGGCNLSALATANLGETSKTRYPQWIPGLGDLGSPNRHDADPREDALLVARLWQHMLTERTLAWGSSARGALGANRGGGGPLDEQALAELTGQQRQVEADQWRERFRFGRILHPTHIDAHSFSLSRFPAAVLPSPVQVRDIAERLRAGGEIPAETVLTDEELFTACQYLGPLQHIDARERIADGRKLIKLLRENLAWALWSITHRDWINEHWYWIRRGKQSATAWNKVAEMNDEKARIRGRLWRLVG